MKKLKLILSNIYVTILRFVSGLRGRASAQRPEGTAGDQQYLDALVHPYRVGGRDIPRAPDGSPLPEFAVRCHFQDGTDKTISVWADSSQAAHWTVFFSVERIFPGEAPLVALEVRHVRGPLPDGVSASGAGFNIPVDPEEPPEYLN